MNERAGLINGSSSSNNSSRIERISLVLLFLITLLLTALVAINTVSAVKMAKNSSDMMNQSDEMSKGLSGAFGKMNAHLDSIDDGVTEMNGNMKDIMEAALLGYQQMMIVLEKLEKCACNTTLLS